MLNLGRYDPWTEEEGKAWDEHLTKSGIEFRLRDVSESTWTNDSS